MTTNADDYAIYKLCNGPCDSMKPLSMFHRQRIRPDGRSYKCKDCCKLYQQEHCFATMVGASRGSDKRSNRRVDEYPYISADDLFKQYVKQLGVCIYCHATMRLGAGVDRQRDHAGCTVERVNNDIAHYAFNCVLACNKCNRNRKATLTFDEMIAQSQ